ncbi:hypothetical protein BDV98DRAFT_652309 [Pterulicium gracile]|uniref:Uncharacterized protein n=1 Tax=Pterulicium gracile TaxID=1884261 RepID=A0A5C3R7F4_9AGAR|nr:hypothetical protein BDV98DRAFT_652309 [Pterula gracilis]
MKLTTDTLDCLVPLLRICSRSRGLPLCPRIRSSTADCPSGDLDDPGLIGTATLVQGADRASLTYVPPDGSFTMGLDCTLGNGEAVCVGADGTEVATVKEVPTPFAVQVADADVGSGEDAQGVESAQTQCDAGASQSPTPSEPPSGAAFAVSPRAGLFTSAIMLVGVLAVL